MEENNTSTDKNTLTALIDYENCGSLKNISLEQYGELIIFVGPQQNVVVLPADSFPEGARITIRQVSGVSRNNVDFHLVLELGRISCCAAGKDKTYHIISSDIRPRSRQWWQLFRMVSQWHVDVVIVERRSFSIVAAVELDDASHLRPERRRRDILLEEVLRQAGIPLLRSHDARKLLQMTGEWLNTTGADQQSPEHRS
ncbi:TPA: DUF2726 domain-containing protein [Escherichia coli]|uniref:DUF2726 domain-containing protein n=1 Tax=Escherichia coli TaxID=562 RepID=UPI001B16877D|nr:DUF2726 domain-containing protein [Escherichia coli]EHI0512015.1 DUF2726 domain-containing protein [Escherichia coli]MDT5381413.1 hypothetical protein [Escherichia coli]HBA5277314.1 DUF2726 domain-containing protein [Escherichia coli]